MTNEEKLYDTLGELLYAVAMADGVIQPEEQQALANLLKDHPWSEEINWSFNYEHSKGSDVEATYEKAIDFCKHHGPSELYPEFIEAMKIVAGAANGSDAKEEELITSFSADLIAKFQQDLDLRGES